MAWAEQKLIEYRPTAPLGAGPLCIDLFAGAGGLAVGFRQAGWSVLAANDLDTAAGETFRLNFPEAHFLKGPISKIDAQRLMKDCGIARGQVDAIIGGPPCQSFSYNNHRRNAEDERARLFSCYLKLVSEIMPKCLVMENVPGILTIGGGKVIEEIRQTLADMNYDCEVEILSAEEYGTPQVRRRVFIVASRVGRAAELLPVPTHSPAKKASTTSPRLPRPITIAKAIGDLPAIENGGGKLAATYAGLRATTKFQKAARESSRRLLNHMCHRLTDVNLNRIRHVPEGGNWRSIPFDLLTAGMKRAKPSDHTKRYGRLSRTGLASTLLTKCDPHWGAYVHPTQDRTISVREAARLQGFPDTFQFANSQLGAHYEQVGNAVPVPVARAIGAAVVAHLEQHQDKVYLEAAE